MDDIVHFMFRLDIDTGPVEIFQDDAAHRGRGFGRKVESFVYDFLRRDGSVYSPDFAAIGRAFGVHAEQAREPGEVRGAVTRALASGGPSLVSIPVNRDLELGGPDKTGWWDVPIPEYHPEQRAKQLAGRAEEQV